MIPNIIIPTKHIKFFTIEFIFDNTILYQK